MQLPGNHLGLLSLTLKLVRWDASKVGLLMTVWRPTEPWAFSSLAGGSRHYSWLPVSHIVMSQTYCYPQYVLEAFVDWRWLSHTGMKT